MSKNVKIILSVTAILFGVYFLNLLVKDDVQEIKKSVDALNQPLTKIAHIEFLDNNQAIAFYESGTDENLYFGSAIFKKNLLGWRFVSGASGSLAHGHKLDWGFSNLEPHLSDYTDLIRGKILDSDIVEVRVTTAEQELFTANIVEYNNGEKFWFLVSDGEDHTTSTITGLSSDGKIIEQVN